MKRLLPWILLALLSVATVWGEPRLYSGAPAMAWSERLATSEIKRLGNTLEKGATPRSRWDYTPALFALSVWKLGEAANNPDYIDFATRAVGSYVEKDGSISTYKLEEFNIDGINPGKVVLLLAEKTKEERYAKAAALLRSQMAQHPRTSEGGFWHKKRYPNQMWLDGLYMASPYLAQYAMMYNEPALFDDVVKQLLLIDKYTYDAKTGLYFHGWDEARLQSWADKKTGLSPNFWSRAIGWYAMALVDSLEYLPVSHPDIDQVTAALERVADGLVRWQDPKSGLWWQVTDQGARAGNYLEASGSSMFVYALAKAVNRGYLPRDKYLPAIIKGYDGLVRDLIKTDEKGLVSLTQVCSVAGLGYTSSTGRPRDGSFDYYVSEPIVANDHKGVGPFVLAGIEVDRLDRVTNVPLRVTGWNSLPAVLARIRAPEFPQRDFPITSFGGKAGGSFDNTTAIRDAIAAANKAGGGRVVIPAGVWLTGAIHLRSNVNLHVSEGATLRFTTNPAAYLPVVLTRWEGVECMSYSPLIYALEQENIAITGKGTLDGGSDWDNWWAWNNKKEKPVKQKAARDRLFEMGEKGVPVEQRVFGEGSYLRPNFIQPYKSKNILIEDVKIIRSPMWEINPVLCANITVRRVNISSHGPNNDGFDPESSRDILVEDCVFDTGDDCIAIKSGRNNDGRRVNVPSENIVIRNCEMKDGHGGVVIGSEISGGVRNVFVENCEMDSPNLDRALRFKSNAQRGGVLENVFMRNVNVGTVAEAVLTIDLVYEEGAKGPHKPVVRNVELQNVRSKASPRVMWIAGFPAATVEDIRFIDCEFLGVTDPDVIKGAGSVLLQNVVVEPAKKAKSANSVPAP